MSYEDYLISNPYGCPNVTKALCYLRVLVIQLKEVPRSEVKILKQSKREEKRIRTRKRIGNNIINF